MANSYYSQDGQDKYLDSLFKEKRNGFFVEVGANDGITFSNTYFFERQRDWKGICIEPHPSAFAKLKLNRKGVLINGCVSKTEKEFEFLKIDGYAEMLSGLVEKYDPSHLIRIERELAEHGGEKEVVKVQGMSLDSILKNNNVSQVDYCSIDTEGGEIEILESANLVENEISVISIENIYYGASVEKYLKKYRYKRIATIGADEIYKKRKFSIFF